MKIKSIIILIMISVIVFVIYLLNIDSKTYYLSIGDEIISSEEDSYSNYIVNYLKEINTFEKFVEFKGKDYRTTDLINDINNNKSIIINGKKQTIKNSLIKADITVLWIGMNDLYYKVGYFEGNEMYNYIDSMLKDTNVLLQLIREYSKEKIVMIGYFNIYSEIDNSYFDYINEKTYKLCSKYDIYFINPNDILSYEDLDTRILNKKGHKIIGSKIKKIVANDFTF